MILGDELRRGSYGVKNCPSGYKRLTDISKCRAANVDGKTYSGSTCYGHYEMTYGCFYARNTGYLHFHTCTTHDHITSLRSDWAPICERKRKNLEIYSDLLRALPTDSVMYWYRTGLF